MRTWLTCSVVALAVAGPARAEDIAGLIKQLQSPDADARRSAAKALSEAGAEAKPAVAALAQAVKSDKDLYVRRFAAQALGALGEDAKSAAPALVVALKDSKKEVAEAAALALGKMGPAGVSALADVVKDPNRDAEVRRKAAEALGSLGKDAKPAVSALITALKDKDVATTAATALGDIGPDAKAAESALNDVVTNRRIRDRVLKQAAAAALKKIQAKG